MFIYHHILTYKWYFSKSLFYIINAQHFTIKQVQRRHLNNLKRLVYCTEALNDPILYVSFAVSSIYFG